MISLHPSPSIYLACTEEVSEASSKIGCFGVGPTALYAYGVGKENATIVWSFTPQSMQVLFVHHYISSMHERGLTMMRNGAGDSNEVDVDGGPAGGEGGEADEQPSNKRNSSGTGSMSTKVNSNIEDGGHKSRRNSRSAEGAQATSSESGRPSRMYSNSRIQVGNDVSGSLYDTSRSRNSVVTDVSMSACAEFSQILAEEP